MGTDSRIYFTIEEANRQLPKLRELFACVLQLRSQLKSSYQLLDSAGHAPSNSSLVPGLIEEAEPLPKEPETQEIREAMRTFRVLIETLRDQLKEIQDLGCILTDIENGSVDWFCLHGDEEILLSWQYGEDTVRYWHEPEVELSGRRPISELSHTESNE